MKAAVKERQEHVRGQFIVMTIQYVIGAVADVLMPRHCAVCGRKLLVGEKYLCTACREDIPMTYNWNMPHNPMADRYNAMIQRGLERYEPYSFAAALFFFRSGSDYRNICYGLKYHGELAIGQHFGKMLGEKIACSQHFCDVDAIVPVPLHWTRKWKRGYNQAEVIARSIATVTGTKVYPEILVRRRHTKTQTKLDIEHKCLNVCGAFSVNCGFIHRFNVQQSCRYDTRKDMATVWSSPFRHILIVDDVFTTGATVNACYKALREVFPTDVRISVATLACV
ncbi:MAG: hypothetical protein NC115_05675 [Bacteroidales bacterium]|nr:hypothetical protein [Bacteroidales bacterium]